jgi:hypothetical protein
LAATPLGCGASDRFSMPGGVRLFHYRCSLTCISQAEDAYRHVVE